MAEQEVSDARRVVLQPEEEEEEETQLMGRGVRSQRP